MRTFAKANSHVFLSTREEAYFARFGTDDARNDCDAETIEDCIGVNPATVGPSESSCLDGSENVWQRGVESLQGQVTAARS